MMTLKILAVDDNETDLLLFEEAIETIEEYLQSKDIIIDFQITQANDGVECLDLIKKTNDYFDLIFLDIKMPRMDGIECLQEVKKISKAHQIVMFTTSDYEEDVIKTKNLGANGYLLKSLDVMEFEENLKTVLLMFIQDKFVYLDYIGLKYKEYLKK